MRPALAAVLFLLMLVGPAVRGAPLRDDARVGVLVDRQGTALVRPAGRERWTPLARRSVLLPGDQVRTPVRGAHAAEIRLAKGGGRLVLGPGGLIELVERGVVRLYRGDLEARGPQLKVSGPGGFETEVAKTPVVLRGLSKRTEPLAEAPRWLTGYRSSTTDEWMGSLVASVDGRDVPLSVGYHKVTVEIRDQIARTTVEQSFRNSTKSTLEGVFYFPLPADASIGGFGMWIGGELVEADIVEKQRARAIYEDILRRRKDPGLLEWSGGNLFKARVFPIFPHSEKRIRIRYTQVLPLEGSKLRYRYALRSELLRSRPLRELRINVNVSSAMPLKGIASPTHEVRVRHSAHAASAEFDAQEYSPERDFELAIDVDRGRALTVVPHRRGEDGYFMLLLLPPDASAGKWQRDLLPEKGALDLVLIADTSGSMDSAARAAQAAFLDVLLALLGPKDRFRLMACDVDAVWLSKEPSSVSEQSAREAHDFLAARPSLGWTDLDRAIAVAQPHVGEKTVVVYVGDGIGTTGDADPAALAQRIRAHGGRGTWHAVWTSSTYEMVVLDAIASLGGGSVRGTGDDPAAAAFGLLAEAAQPAVKDLAVSFQGLRTARVYPERLPNLAAGRQQVVLGRFLPTGKAQRGTVVVTGTLAGRPVRYTADLELAENESGNSFLPRLWARRHIDALLAQGRSAEVQDEIVAFSEEFGIMTPYTSFLVLESDEDRERYGVARRVKMRDGERFFATGRDRAATELLGQQMKLARQWRLQLRRRMLREIATLGTHLHGAVAWGDVGVDFRGRGELSQAAGIGGRASLFGGQAEELRDSNEAAGEDGFYSDADAEDLDVEEEEMELDEAANEPMAEDELPGTRAPFLGPSTIRSLAHRSERGGYLKSGRERLRREGWWSRPSAPLHPSQLGFPYLNEPSEPPVEEPAPAWDAETLALVRKLDRRAALHALPGGVEVRQEGGAVHPRHGREVSHDTAHGIYGAAGWFVRTAARWGEPIDAWLAGDERGVLAVGRRLGRKRAAADSDRLKWWFPLRDHSLGDLARSYAKWSVAATQDELGIVELVLTPPTPGPPQLRLKIDAAKGVLLEWATFRDGQPTTTVRFKDHVQAGGMWWATRIAYHDGDDRVVGRYRLEVKELDADACRKALAAARAHQGDVIFLGASEPALAAAKQAAHDQRAGFAEHFRLVLHWAGSQQWDRVFQSWEKAAATVKDRPGATWLRAGLYQQGRKGAELEPLLQALAQEVAATDGPATDFLARHLLDVGNGVLQPNEMLALLEALRPAYRRGDADWRELAYLRRRAGQLKRAGQPDQAREIYRRIATTRPDDSQAVVDFVNALREAHRPGEALRVVEKALQQRIKWLDSEAYSLYDQATFLLWQHRDIEALLEACEAWIATNPSREAAYARYLSALLFLDREPEADAWVKARFAAPGPANEPEKAALAGAIQFALGEGWNYYTRRIEEKWWRPLGELARRLLQGDRRARYLASHILGHWRFRRTDAYAALHEGLLRDLTADGAIESMDLDRLAIYLSRIPWGKADSDATVWRAVVDRLKARWRATPPARRVPLADHVLQLLDQHGESAEALAFARERLKLADDDHRPHVAGQLLQRLSQESWTAAIEDEMLRVLPAVPARGVADEFRRAAYGLAIRWLSDQLVQMRIEALLGPLQEREKLPRNQLRSSQRKARAEARAAAAARFAAERDRAEEQAKRWFHLERLCLLARLGKGTKEIDGETRELLASVPADSTHGIDRLLEERCAYVLAYLATRRKAPAGLADAALALLEKRAARDTGPQEEYEPDWKYHLFRLLVALDRADALAARLETWIVPSQVESRWRIAHGYLMAETGRLAEAAASFEEVKRIDELGAADYAALANWYLALGDEQRHEAALLDRYKVMPEWRISRRIYDEQNAISRHGEGVPRELDPDALRALRALLAKASRPVSHIHLVRNLYRAVKDFRLLESLPYGVLGHTPEGIYPYLQGLGRVLGEVHEEATCDALAARLPGLQVRGDHDRRGLLLLEALVERRAGEVLNQPGPHAKRGLAALQAAFKGAWLPGERRHMGALLASLGKIPQEPFAAEQVRQLEAVQRLEPEGTLDRLAIAQSLFETHWAYGRKDRAVDGLTAALDAYQRSRDGLTAEALPALDRLVGWLSERGHFRTAETRLDAELASPPAPAVHAWLQERLFRVYVQALGRKGQLAIGQGHQLYEAAQQRMAAAMWQYGPDQIASTLTQYCALHRTAQKRAGIREAGRELEAFAYEKLPELIRRVPTNAHRMANTVANTLRELRGPRPALKFVITYLEKEPAWWRRVGNTGWGTFAYSLAKWRAKAGRLGDLEPRLLAIVKNEIERDLLSLQALNRAMYQTSHRWFWREKQEAFLAVALRVIETNPDSPARLQYAAEYIWRGLHRYDRAIAVLLEADRRGRLREAGRHTLVRWLHERKRYPESLPQLEKLLAARPDKLDYHALKIVALHFSGRDADARQALDEADRRFRKPPWTEEGVLATLARACRECKFFERAVPYYEEVIPLHQRTQINRGVGRGTLSLYYGELAECHAALGRHRKAVEAASAAVVSWGRTHQNRATALRALQAVIAEIPDLDKYVAGYEVQVEKTGLDAPLVRQALGLAYLQRHQPMQAVPHLLAARELQPLDTATHQVLLQAYDAAKKPAEARHALLQSIAVAPLNLDLYAELGRRLTAAGDADGAERAWTSLAEAQPNEADGHRKLAQHRETQNRHADAIVSWRQVVRIRTDEPEGWLSLALAQIRTGRLLEARATLEHVLATQWDERFGDVHDKARKLLK
ncbi:MAG: VIT domain-containing protein [Planctomycetota bacterium]|jgi:Tfp pilus assembly protein PilF